MHPRARLELRVRNWLLSFTAASEIAPVIRVGKRKFRDPSGGGHHSVVVRVPVFHSDDLCELVKCGMRGYGAFIP